MINLYAILWTLYYFCITEHKEATGELIDYYFSHGSQIYYFVILSVLGLKYIVTA